MFAINIGERKKPFIYYETSIVEKNIHLLANIGR